jgi:hypothetical protein
MLAMGLVPAVLILILRGQLPESPRWLYGAGRAEDAKRVLSDLLQQPVELDIAQEPDAGTLPFKALFSREFVKRTIFATVPWFCMDVALYGMALFTPIILASTGFGHAKNTFWSRDIHALRGALFLDVVLVMGFAAGIWLIKRVGVIGMQVGGFVGMVIGLALVAVSSAAGNVWGIFAGFALFNFCVNAGPNGTTYIVAAVEFPTSIRASGDGLATASGKIGASLGIFLMPVLQASLGLSATIAIVCLVAAAGLAVTVFLKDELYAGSRLSLRGEHSAIMTLDSKAQDAPVLSS